MGYTATELPIYTGGERSRKNEEIMRIERVVGLLGVIGINPTATVQCGFCEAKEPNEIVCYHLTSNNRPEGLLIPANAMVELLMRGTMCHGRKTAARTFKIQLDRVLTLDGRIAVKAERTQSGPKGLTRQLAAEWDIPICFVDDIKRAERIGPSIAALANTIIAKI